jgi:hypothetical protein
MGFEHAPVASGFVNGVVSCNLAQLMTGCADRVDEAKCFLSQCGQGHKEKMQGNAKVSQLNDEGKHNAVLYV